MSEELGNTTSNRKSRRTYKSISCCVCARFFNRDGGHPLRPEFLAELFKDANLFSRVLGSAWVPNTANHATGFNSSLEDSELGSGKHVGEVKQLKAKSDIRFVAPVKVQRLVVGHPLKGARPFLIQSKLIDHAVHDVNQ